MRGRSQPGQRHPRPAPGAPRPAWRAPHPCCAGSTPWSSTAPAGTPRSPPAPPPARTPRAASPRRPDQRFHPPAPLRVPLDLPPDEGESEPARPSGTSPGRNPGQLSPGRLELLTSSVERCRGRPGRLPRPGRARLHYVEREDPGAGAPGTALGRPLSPARDFSMPAARTPGAARCETAARRTPAVARTPLHEPFAMAPETLQHRLTELFLRWFLIQPPPWAR